MVSDTGLIVMSIISLAGMLLLFTLNNTMWFKKQNFKAELFNVKATNKLNLRKLEKEMGLTSSKKSTKEASIPSLGVVGQLLPLLKGLDGEQIGGLIEQFVGPNDDQEGGPIDILMGYAEDHPEVVTGILEAVTGKKGEGDDKALYD